MHDQHLNHLVRRGFERLYWQMRAVQYSIIRKKPSLSIFSDGWSNLRNEYLVNSILVIPNQKPLFYGFIDCDGESQTFLQFVTDLIRIIEEIGSEKANSIVTDNAITIQGVWDIIEKLPSYFLWLCSACVEFIGSRYLHAGRKRRSFEQSNDAS